MFSCNENGNNIIKVKDNGIGISEEHHNNIYDMFYRAENSSGGSGLGLYIVKEMIGKLNGKIHFESNTGQGTTFILELPVG